MFNNFIRLFYVLSDVELNLGSGGAKIAVDIIGGDSFEVVKQAFGSEGTATMVDAGNPLPVTDTDAVTALNSIAGEDFATQTTLAFILAKIDGPSTTGTSTNVADSNANQTLLAANVARLGATIYNDSTEILYLKLGATASLTSFTARLIPNAYYEIPFRYTGIIDGIWANNSTGNARITELT